MAKRRNKYDYLYIVQGRYGDTYRWEDLTAADSQEGGRRDLRDYRMSETAHYIRTGRRPGVNYRLIQRRVLRKGYED